MIRSRGIRFWVDGFFIRGNEFVISVAFSHLLKKFAEWEQKIVHAGHTNRKKNLLRVFG